MSVRVTVDVGNVGTGIIPEASAKLIISHLTTLTRMNTHMCTHAHTH